VCVTWKDGVLFPEFLINVGEVFHVRAADHGFAEERRFQNVVAAPMRQRSTHKHEITMLK